MSHKCLSSTMERSRDRSLGTIITCMRGSHILHMSIYGGIWHRRRLSVFLSLAHSVKYACAHPCTRARAHFTGTLGAVNAMVFKRESSQMKKKINI